MAARDSHPLGKKRYRRPAVKSWSGERRRRVPAPWRAYRRWHLYVTGMERKNSFSPGRDRL